MIFIGMILIFFLTTICRFKFNFHKRFPIDVFFLFLFIQINIVKTSLSIYLIFGILLFFFWGLIFIQFFVL
jgi:hypothetical protein